MSVENVGSMNELLSHYKTHEWTKSSIDSRPIDVALDAKPREVTKSFGEFLSESINDVNNLQKHANEAIEKLVSGRSKNIHETMLAVEKANIAFRTMNQIRLKVIDAYKEIIKMQV